MKSEKPLLHIGKNVQCIRMFRGLTQSCLATELEIIRGKTCSQQAISDLEKKAVIDDKLLQQIAGILKVDLQTLQSLEMDTVIGDITKHSIPSNNKSKKRTIKKRTPKRPVTIYQNPVEKIVELHVREHTELKKENKDLKKRIEKLQKTSSNKR